MPNGDLLVDFKRAEVADTVSTSVPFLSPTVVSLTIRSGLPHLGSSLHRRGWQRLLVLVYWQETLDTFRILDTLVRVVSSVRNTGAIILYGMKQLRCLWNTTRTDLGYVRSSTVLDCCHDR